VWLKHPAPGIRLYHAGERFIIQDAANGPDFSVPWSGCVLYRKGDVCICHSMMMNPSSELVASFPVEIPGVTT
jgi:hypothetical protein